MEFSIWSEGYRATGGYGHAQYEGVGHGETFQEACDDLARRNQVFNKYYDPERLTSWGCRLFDNESDARKSFG